jgi:hypothetical protein
MSEGGRNYDRTERYLLQRLHKVGRSVCVGSALFFRLLLLGLDLGALVANEFQDVIVVEHFGTGIEDLERVSLCISVRAWETHLHIRQLRKGYATWSLGRVDRLAINSGPLSHVMLSILSDHLQSRSGSPPSGVVERTTAAPKRRGTKPRFRLVMVHGVCTLRSNSN